MNSRQNDAEQSRDAIPTSSSATSQDTRPHTPVPNEIWLSASHPGITSRTNLQQASVALDAAFERITQLRNSINNLLHRMPPDSSNATPHSPLPGSSEATISPGYSALVLTDGELVEDLNLRSERLRTLVPPSARQRLEDFESTRVTGRRYNFQWERFLHGERSRYLRDEVPSTQTTTVTPLRSRSPPMPDLVVPHTRTSTGPRGSVRRDLYSGSRDESSTMIGRRVAARIAAGSQDGNAPQLSALEQGLQVHTAQITHELQNMADRLAMRRAEQSAASGTAGNSSNGTSLGGPGNSQPEGMIFRPFGRRTVVESSYEGLRPRTGESLPPLRNTAADNASGVERPNQTGLETQDNIVALPAFLALGDPLEVRDRLRELLARDRQELPASSHSATEDSGQGENTSGRGDTSSQPQTGQTRRRRGWGKRIWYHF